MEFGVAHIQKIDRENNYNRIHVMMYLSNSPNHTREVNCTILYLLQIDAIYLVLYILIFFYNEEYQPLFDAPTKYSNSGHHACWSRDHTLEIYHARLINHVRQVWPTDIKMMFELVSFDHQIFRSTSKSSRKAYIELL